MRKINILILKSILTILFLANPDLYANTNIVSILKENISNIHNDRNSFLLCINAPNYARDHNLFAGYDNENEELDNYTIKTIKSAAATLTSMKSMIQDVSKYKETLSEDELLQIHLLMSSIYNEYEPILRDVSTRYYLYDDPIITQALDALH